VVVVDAVMGVAVAAIGRDDGPLVASVCVGGVVATVATVVSDNEVVGTAGAVVTAVLSSTKGVVSTLMPPPLPVSVMVSAVVVGVVLVIAGCVVVDVVDAIEAVVEVEVISGAPEEKTSATVVVATRGTVVSMFAAALVSRPLPLAVSELVTFELGVAEEAVAVL